MTDDDTRLAEIRTRLAAATPGEWYVDGPHPMCGEIWVCTKTPPATQPDGTPWPAMASPEVIATSFDDAPADADLVAHAPADIAHLLALVERLTAENDALRDIETAARALAQRDPCFTYVAGCGADDIETCQFCLQDNRHDDACAWVGLVAALAAAERAAPEGE